jgi:hypothetical protein
MGGRDPEKDRNRYHLLLLAENLTGYRNLLKLCSDAQFDGYYYRVKVHKAGDPPATYTVLSDSFQLEHIIAGFTWQISSGGWFEYKNPAVLNRPRAVRRTVQSVGGPAGHRHHQRRVDASSPWYHVDRQHRPVHPSTMDIHIAAGGDADIDEGDPVTGTFVASGRPLRCVVVVDVAEHALDAVEPAGTEPVPRQHHTGTGWHGWGLNTASPIAMEPCGYVVSSRSGTGRS